MESKNITLKRPLSTFMLRFHLRKFFRLTNFSSDYISLQTKLSGIENGISRHSVGKHFILNVKNLGEVTYYMDYLVDQYNKEYSNENDRANLKQLSFIFVPTNKNEYENYLNKISQNAFEGQN